MRAAASLYAIHITEDQMFALDRGSWTRVAVRREALLARSRMISFDSVRFRVNFNAVIHVPVKKVFSLLATITLSVAASASATIVFNPANPLTVVDQGGFSGSATDVEDPFVEALVRFSFTGLNPSPLPSSFQISGISLEGDGITTSLSFSSITITGNGNFATSFVSLNTPISNLNFANSRVSFNVPGGVINDGALFTVTARYRSGVEFDQLTSNTGPIFEAQNAAPIPEPGTWAAAALLVGTASYIRWRKRKVA